MGQGQEKRDGGVSGSSIATRTVRAGVDSDSGHNAVMPPVHLSSTFRFHGLGQKAEYDYTRSGNPTRSNLAEALADLEGGFGATITGSGMAAIHLVCQLVGRRELLIAPHDCYGGTHRLLTTMAKVDRFDVLFVDQSDRDALAAAFALGPKMILVETPSNPLLRVTDFSLVREFAEKFGTVMVADNTFLSPVFQNPLALGADIVVHSTTKYLNGHSDVVGGVAIAKTESLHEELEWWANCLGVTGAPFDSFLTLRGLRTLQVRMAQQAQTAKGLAELLRQHPRVRQVFYPGLEDHPNHQVAKRQQMGFGAMLSFELANLQEVERFVQSLVFFSLAESLGGVESLVAHPATMTHAAMSPEARRTAGISDGLIRLSVGLESAQDLGRDITAALNRVSIEAVS
ncbi:MAG: cystathionine gamma-synthase [Pseudomonadota bacterium]